MSIHDEKTDPYGSPPPSDPHTGDARLFAGLVINALAPIRTRQEQTHGAVVDLANEFSRHRAFTDRRLAVLEATRLLPTVAAVVVAVAAFGLAAVAATKPALAARACVEAVP